MGYFYPMGKIIALDVGTKKTGIAETDPLQIIASALTTVTSKELYTFLDQYFSENEVETIVVGEPKRLHGEAGDIAEFIAKVVTQLQQKFPNTAIVRMDERFTSKMAFQSMLDGGMKKKKRQDKGMIDQISATLILQSFLDQKR